MFQMTIDWRTDIDTIVPQGFQASCQDSIKFYYFRKIDFDFQEARYFENALKLSCFY